MTTQSSNPYDGLIPDKKEDTSTPDPVPVPNPGTKPETGENSMGKGLLRSKTFWVNFLTAAVSIGTYLTNSDLLANNPEIVAVGGGVLGILNILLRLVTKEPITSVK